MNIPTITALTVNDLAAGVAKWESGAVLLGAAVLLWILKDLLIALLASSASNLVVRKDVEDAKEEIIQRTESEVIKANGVMLGMVESSLFAEWIKDTRGRMIYINPMYTAMFGITEQQYLGNTDYDVWSREVADQYFSNDEQVFRTGKPILTIEDIPLDYRDENSERIPTPIFKFPIFEHVGGRRTQKVKYVAGRALDASMVSALPEHLGSWKFDDKAWERIKEIRDKILEEREETQDV